jgi:aryl-alcohol dehydrogenase-like predicted oxidoreductase
MLARRLDEEYAEYAATSGLATMVYTPLAGGLLTGRHTFDAPAGHGRFGDASNAQLYRERYWDQRLFQAVDRLTGIASTAGVPLAELALRWTISRPVTRSVLLGASRVDQFTANVAALGNGPLDADVLAAIDEVGADLRGPMPAYNR